MKTYKFVSHEELEKREQEESRDRVVERIYYFVVVSCLLGLFVGWVAIFMLIFGE